MLNLTIFLRNVLNMYTHASQLLTLCDSDDSVLSKLPCYRTNPSSLVPLKVSGLAALAACHYLPDQREKIFTVLYKAINSTTKELQEAGKKAMKKVCTNMHVPYYFSG